MTAFKDIEPLRDANFCVIAKISQNRDNYIFLEGGLFDLAQACALRDWLSAALGEDKGREET